MSNMEFSQRSGRLVVTLQGDLDVEAAQALGVALEEKLQNTPPADAVVLDFCGLTGCSVFARSELIKLQGILRKRPGATVYISDVPRFRGLALWVINLAEDPNAKTCMTQAAADAWLSDGKTRLEEIRERAGQALAAMKGGK